MKTLLLILLLGVNTINVDHLKEPPKVTDPQIYKLIDLLGSDCYSVRETATEKLIEIGYPAISALDEAMNQHDDLEITMRAAQIRNTYFNINCLLPVDEDISIYNLSNKIRFPEGIEKGKRDIGLEYYHKGRRAYNQMVDSINRALRDTVNNCPVNPITESVVRDTNAESLGFQIYLYDQMRSGLSRDDVKSLIEESQNNIRDKVRLYDPNAGHEYDENGSYVYHVPPPFDDSPRLPDTNPPPEGPH